MSPTSPLPPLGGRRRAIIDGTAGLSLAKTNAARELHGLPPLAGPLPVPEAPVKTIPRAIASGGDTAPVRAVRVRGPRRTSCCGGGAQPNEAAHYPPQAYDPVSLTTADVASRCQVIAKSFRRFASVLELADSVAHFYPGLEILIADDSLEDGEEYPDIVRVIQSRQNVRWFTMPFDTGLSAGRNLLVREATKDIIILCDDDFVFTPQTKIERMLTVLDVHAEISLVSGIVQNHGRAPANWVGKFKWMPQAKGNRLHMLALTSEWEEAGGVEFRRSDVCWNFFVARRESLLAHPWDNNIKVAGEHIDFFVTRFHAQQVSAYTPEVTVLHKPARPKDYAVYRNRTKTFYDGMKAKWGITDLQPMSPQVEYRKKRNPSKQLPGVVRQAANLAKATVKHIADGGSLLPIIDTQIRVAVCEPCQWFRPEDRRCAHPACGCFIDEKATWRSETCPIGKWPMDTKPNIVVLGVGHSGTTILTKMLVELGWSGRGLDEEYAEPPAIRAMNEIACQNGKLGGDAAKLLTRLQSPWIIKDPRFCETLPLWQPLLEQYKPLLVWIVRDPAAVEASYERRGEPALTRGFTRTENMAHAAASFIAWPWAKVKLNYEQITLAVALFKPSQSSMSVISRTSQG